MQAAAIPANDPERLRTLATYGILDTPAEAAFDALTTLTARIIDVPIALISIVDRDRQWFKSRYGLEAHQTGRTESLCGHVVAAEAALVVDDTHADVRFSDNPLVIGPPRVRFYAGVPLRVEDGHVLGTLCAIDRQPRALSPAQLDVMALLSGQVIALLELRRKGRLLAEHEAELRALFDAMGEAAVLHDRTGAIIKCNRAAERILELSADQIMGRTSVDRRWGAFRDDGSPYPGEEHPAMDSMRTGQRHSDERMGLRLPRGEHRWISINTVPLVDVGTPAPYAVVTTFRDVTAQRDASARAEAIARQERLITTGTLAAGVGHEINSPLGGVVLNLERALEEVGVLSASLPPAHLDELTASLVAARDGAERVRGIVRGLRAMGREGAPPVPTLLAPIVDTALRLVIHELRPKASVAIDLGEVVRVLADDARLTQVLVNLLVNAAQAFESSDPLVNRVVVRATRDGDQVAIDVVDNGPGIPPHLLARIFDPFFTTKAIGTASGLGLSISHGLVVGLGGQLTARSRPGHTSFRITLAAVDEPVPADPVAPRSQRVLCVDDDVPLLRTLVRMLGRPYDVVGCHDPREAWALFESGQRFAVVFCDLMMPHLDGKELYGRVRDLDPEQATRFVFISGGVVRPDVQGFLAELPNERLEKPFSLDHLRAVAQRYVGR